MPKKNTQPYELLEKHFHTYIANKILHGLHHPNDSKMKVLNNMFACYPTKSSTYSKKTNMITSIVLNIAFYSSRYKDIFTNLYIRLGVHIIYSLYLHLQRMYTRI